MREGVRGRVCEGGCVREGVWWEGIVEREVPVCGVRMCGEVEELWRGRVCEEGGGV